MENGERVGLKSISCSSPYILSNGCEPRDAAGQTVNLDGLEFDISSTSGGSTILVMVEKTGGGTTVIANLVYEAVRTTLERDGLKIREALAIQDRYWEGADVIVGYFITANGNAYSSLMKVAVD
jgi:hypothetical protein